MTLKQYLNIEPALHQRLLKVKFSESVPKTHEREIVFETWIVG